MDHHGHIALTDFGLSKENLTNVADAQLTTFCGTAEYIAPELLKGLKYGAAVDWWSFGVLLYEMLVGYPAFYSETKRQTCEKIVGFGEHLHFPPEARMSHSAEALIRALLCEREVRLGAHYGAGELQDHHFFDGIDFAALTLRSAGTRTDEI